MKQVVKLVFTDDKGFQKTYKININKHHHYFIEINLANLRYYGYIKILVRFIQHSDGMVYCKIYDIFANRKKRLIYNKPITSLLTYFDKQVTTYIQGYGKDENATVYITDAEGNIIGEHHFNSVTYQHFLVEVSFANQQKQKETDKLYRELLQQEVFYKLHKDEIDTIKSLVAAYDNQHKKIKDKFSLSPNHSS